MALGNCEIAVDEDYLCPTKLAAVKNGPRHVGLIMDGNRRWAKQHGMDTYFGHWAGAQALNKSVRRASDMGIQVLTCYSFSTENWNRPEDEKKALFGIFEQYLKEQKEPMRESGVRLGYIGDIEPFPETLKELLQETVDYTKCGRRVDLVLALNYGGRDEIRRAMVKLAQECQEGRLVAEDINEQHISDCLDTHPWGDIDLLVRTSGEMRTSNFLLWQQQYSELFFSEILWPDFRPHHLLDIVLNFQNRQRRRGG